MPNTSVKNFHLETDRSVEIMMEYFYGINEVINQLTTTQTQYLSQKALNDVIGG